MELYVLFLQTNIHVRIPACVFYSTSKNFTYYMLLYDVFCYLFFFFEYLLHVYIIILYYYSGIPIKV